MISSRRNLDWRGRRKVRERRVGDRRGRDNKGKKGPVKHLRTNPSFQLLVGSCHGRPFGSRPQWSSKSWTSCVFCDLMENFFQLATPEFAPLTSWLQEIPRGSGGIFWSGVSRRGSPVGSGGELRTLEHTQHRYKMKIMEKIRQQLLLLTTKVKRHLLKKFQVYSIWRCHTNGDVIASGFEAMKAEQYVRCKRAREVSGNKIALMCNGMQWTASS